MRPTTALTAKNAPLTVHDWQPPRYHKELTFDRSSYGPGDRVNVKVRIVPVQGGGPGANGFIAVTAKCIVDGIDLTNEQLNQAPLTAAGFNGNITDDEGRVEFAFNLPAHIARGVGTVTIACGDETLRRTIPIVLRDLQVDFYPEGGDLIGGVSNRVYFQARTPANRPADIAGSVLDETGKTVARLKTLTDDQEPGINQGQGSFTFTPQFKKRYTLRLDSPIGIDRTFALPSAKDKGIALTIAKGVIENEIDVTLQGAKMPRELLVGAYCRGRMLDYKLVAAPANKPVHGAVLKPQRDVGGVYRVTVFEKLVDGPNLVYRPLAERLIYRKSIARLDVAIESDRKTYQPGEPVELLLEAKNEREEFVPAYALVAVVDQSLLKLADEKTARSMPTHFLLTTEVRNPEDLEHADFFLGPHPKAAQSLDLLLGCQGWRRFAEQNPQEFQRKQQQVKPPVFLANSAIGPQLLDAEQKDIEKLDQVFVVKAIDLEKQLAEREKQEAGQPALATIDQARAQVSAAAASQVQAEEKLRAIHAFLLQFGLGGALLMLLFLGFFLISVGLRRLADGGPARTWLFMGTSLLGVLFVASIFGTFLLMGERLFDDPRFGGAVPKVAMFAPAPGMPPAPPLPPNPREPDDETIREELLLIKEAGEAEKAKPMRNIAPAANAANFDAPLAPQGMLQDFANGNRDFPMQQNADRLWRQQGNYQALLQKQLGRRVQLPPVNDPSIVREYAHQHRPAKDDARRDFTETLYWHPVLPLADGKAQITFDLSDAVTRFQVLVLSHSCRWPARSRIAWNSRRSCRSASSQKLRSKWPTPIRLRSPSPSATAAPRRSPPRCRPTPRD